MPLPFSYNNAREGRYGSASSTGTLFGAGVAGGTISGGSSMLSVVPETQVFRFAQTTASTTFSTEGIFAGRSVLNVSADLRSGALNVQNVPVGFVQRNGVNLIDNTRSAVALQEAGVPMNQWNLINRTGQPFFETSVRINLLITV